MATKSTDTEHKGLIKTMKSLDANMTKLASFYEPHRYLWMGFFRGIVYGLGILVAFAIVLPILLSLLSMVDWVPYIGDIIADIVERLQTARESI